ncbi:dethiobiotin synthase [Vibrio sp. SCSIO 43136]|uniref:dethiobiotin synthase n=1 Tax=Vibrio sp. SCSIO 43136 TaxID=2819101 RepID=UPI002074ECB4|nr:dethiobiotin synthase [Vibrio sp. SCSIO 43136]USD64372.1 ATP-dependent dethiobiotin synthetase BioD [Vibrio sp. SCSIO 43136]
MIDAFFIAGTDTDVGKTVASKAILQAIGAQGYSTIGYKPVAAGCEDTPDGKRNSDALHLQQASTLDVTYDDVNPYALTLPTSPHIASKHDGVEIDYAVLSEKLAQHKAQADVVLVEGAGGWYVPTTDTDQLSTWVQSEKLPVVLVVGIKLGCLSHAILTAKAIEQDGLNLVGWVANRVNPGTEHYAEIIEALEKNIPAPKLGMIPYVPSIKSKDIGKYINISPLRDLPSSK